MSKILEILKNNDLVDNRQLWSRGIIHKGIKLSAASAAASAEPCILSVKDNELIVSKIIRKQPVPIEKYTRENIETISYKKIFFGLNKRITIKTKDGKKAAYNMGVNKKAVDDIVQLFQK